ncbi:MAG: FliM/FliN family flagellar motor switch protein [Candidatus Brocadiia bacterium]
MSPPDEGKLSKDEVETLLQATEEEEQQQTEEAAPQEAEPTRRVHGYDFQQPSRFSRTQMEKLRRLNESLAQNATSHAGRLLRSNVKTQLVSMDQMKWENLLEEVGETVVGFVLLLEPLGYRGVVTIDRQFAAVALERMMGGQVDAGDAATMEFTELDVRVLGGLLQGAFLEPLPELWSNIGDFRVERGSFVEELATLDLFPPAEDFVQFSFLLQSNVGSGQVSLAVPFQAVRDLPPKEQEETAETPSAADESIRRALRDNLRETRVELTVLLGAADIPVGELVKLQQGDVIVLDTRVGDALEVHVNDKKKLGGYPGVHNGKYAVKITIQE